MIGALGTEELGKQIKRPSQLVRKMLEKHNQIMAGGAPLPDDEYEIAVEQWKQIAEPVEIKSGLETIQLTCFFEVPKDIICHGSRIAGRLSGKQHADVRLTRDSPQIQRK